MGIDIEQVVQTFGYLGLCAIVFAECGLFFGFFLPGDSLLLTAGLFASTGVLDIRILIPALFISAVLGDSTGYLFGRKVGPPLFNRDASFLFRKKNLLAAQAFYEKHGGKTVVIARFMPFIRTFAPIVAGAAEMPYQKFLLFNVIGGLVWAVGLTLLGFWLGGLSEDVEWIEKYFDVFVMLVIFISVLPALIHAWKEYRHEVIAFIRSRFSGGAKAGNPEAE